MLNDQVPECYCGKKSFEAGGGSFGGNGSTQWFTCKNCHRPVLIIFRDHMGVLIQPRELLEEISGEGFDYINGPLHVTMCAYGTLVEDVHEIARKAARHLNLEMLGLPRETKIVALAPDYKRVLQAPDGTFFEDESRLRLFDEMCDRQSQTLGRFKCLNPPTPPKVPQCLVIRVQNNKGEWVEIDHLLSQALEVPPDPRRTAHDKFWSEIFSEAKDIYENISPKEVENGYLPKSTGIKPWYEFTVGRFTFTVGPRSHVLSLEMRSDSVFEPYRLRVLAERDNVTYEADDTWKSQQALAKSALIHADGREKFMEYLTCALFLAEEQS